VLFPIYDVVLFVVSPMVHFIKEIDNSGPFPPLSTVQGVSRHILFLLFGNSVIVK
jgi:hypothetical protein